RPRVFWKGRLKIPAQVMPEQDPQVRIHNWDEVYLPLDMDTAKTEATRCIQCTAAPCIEACPLSNDIPAALWLLENGDVQGAARKFRETSNLPDVCGRLCPQERLCEGYCVVGKNAKPVAIGRLETFVSDYLRNEVGYQVPELPPSTGKRVVVVGSGPSGLAAAEELALKGHSMTVFDAWPQPGGLLLYGIPSFAMAKGLLYQKLDYLRKLGIEFICNTYIGKEVTVDDLLEGSPWGKFDAVFLGHGAGVGVELRVPGEDLPGIFTAADYLARGNLAPELLPESLREPLPAARRVSVIGGGDTAMECVRTAVRRGAETVTCVYRRTEPEMPGRTDERVHAREENVQFCFLAASLEFFAGEDGRVARMKCQRMELGEPDESGRRRPVPIPGSEFILETDMVIKALGHGADRAVAASATNVETERWGGIVIDRERGATSRPGIFAGGDAVNGADLVVTALRGGRIAAKGIHQYLTGK
ncbi:MAG: NAD(P)-dependent oxidoreductase, partial [Candidatus Bathyarchaeota archaeon]|nr:NAD(P)-dependent oxidoreductase [Candidatus Bathyarchaeota archaeon]